MNGTGNTPRHLLAAAVIGGLVCVALLFDRSAHERNLQPATTALPSASPLPAATRSETTAPSDPLKSSSSGASLLGALGLGGAADRTDPAPNPFSTPAAAGPSQPAPTGSSGSRAPAPAAAGPGVKAPAAGPLRARFQQAMAAHKRGNTAEALAGYQEVLREKPDFTQAYLNLSMLYMQMKRPGEALTQLKLAARHDPKNPAVPYQLAQTMVALKRMAEALAPLQDVVRLAPKSRPARASLAQLLVALKRPQDAYTEWTRLATEDPKDGEAALAAGSIAFDPLKRNAEAEKWLRQAVANAPKDPRVPLLLGRVLATNSKLPAAETLLVTSVHKFPGVIELLTLLSDVRWARGDKSGAIDALSLATQRVPATVQRGVPLARLRVALGRLYALNRQWQPAAGQLRQAADLVPREPEPRAMLAEALLRGGDRTGAVAAMQQVLQLDPKRLATRHALADTLAVLGRTIEAQTQYAEYLKAKPRDFAVRTQQAELYERQSDTTAAIAAWSRATEGWPENPLPPLHRARLLHKLGRDEESLQWYRYVLQVKPNQPDALAGAAAIEEKRGQPMQALTHLRSLVAVRPGDEGAYTSLLRVAAAKAQLPATIYFMRTLVAKDPSQQAACAALLKGYEMTGQVDEGRAAMQQIIRRHPRATAPRVALDSFDLDRAQRKLAELRKNHPSPTTAATTTPAPHGPTPTSGGTSPQGTGDTPAPATDGAPDHDTAGDGHQDPTAD